MIDGLTGVKNHRVFQEILQQSWSNAVRHHTPLSLVLLDIDHFKHYNDSFGHPAGDEVLRAVGRILEECSRDGDVVARYGGEEFVVILPETDSVGAMALAERFRVRIEEETWPKIPVTASFGVATLSMSTTDKEMLVNETDRAMYYSKWAGRNTVTFAGELVQEDSSR